MIGLCERRNCQLHTLDNKNFSPAFLVIEEHAHYTNMCAIEIFTHLCFTFLSLHSVYEFISSIVRAHDTTVWHLVSNQSKIKILSIKVQNRFQFWYLILKLQLIFITLTGIFYTFV